MYSLLACTINVPISFKHPCAGKAKCWAVGACLNIFWVIRVNCPVRIMTGLNAPPYLWLCNMFPTAWSVPIFFLTAKTSYFHLILSHCIYGDIFWSSTLLSRQAVCLITVDKESRWEFASQTREDGIVKQGRSTKQLTPAAAQYTSDTGYWNPFNKQQTNIVATSVTNTEFCRNADIHVIYRFLDIL